MYLPPSSRPKPGSTDPGYKSKELASCLASSRFVLIASHQSPGSQGCHGGVGRGYGVGLGLGVTVGLTVAVGVGVGVTLGVAVGVTVGVALGVGVTVGVGVEVGDTVGEGVGVAPHVPPICRSYSVGFPVVPAVTTMCAAPGSPVNET